MSVSGVVDHFSGSTKRSNRILRSKSKFQFEFNFRFLFLFRFRFGAHFQAEFQFYSIHSISCPITRTSQKVLLSIYAKLLFFRLNWRPRSRASALPLYLSPSLFLFHHHTQWFLYDSLPFYFITTNHLIIFLLFLFLSYFFIFISNIIAISAC